MNLILAVLWIVLAVTLFVTGRGRPDGAGLPIRLDVLALLLALYNVLRWWGVQKSRAAWKEHKQSAAQSRRPLRRPGDEAEPDPNFIFDEPPGTGERGASTPR